MLLTSETRLTQAPEYRTGALLLYGSIAIILGAWMFEAAGYAPCELCLVQRYAYYFAIPVAFLALIASSGGMPRLAMALFGLIVLAYLANAGLGVYHSGVEWKFWQGPTTCSGAAPVGGGNLLGRLKNVHAVRCDEVQLRILGLSLAGWNVLASLWFAVLAGLSIARIRRSSI
jgi:disulfide bond formation protein DsbB